MFEVAFDELDDTHNLLMMWKHFRGQKIGKGVFIHSFSMHLSRMGLINVMLGTSQTRILGG